MIVSLAPFPATRDEAAAFWCARLAEGDLDSGQRAAFDRWIEADPGNSEAFGDAVAIWQGIDACADAPAMIRHRAEAVESLHTANARSWARAGMPRWRVPAAIAACFALILVAAGLLLHDDTARYATGTGERRVVMLADGSRLTLDAATVIDVRLDDDRRSLELVTGRAKFDVAHDPLRPFSVRARNRVTIATGTSFSVELLPRQMRVVLYEGRTEVIEQPGDVRTPLRPLTAAGGRSTGAARAPLVLTPGKELIASTTSGSQQVVAIDMPRSLSWEAGQLSFEGEPLALAAERLNRYVGDRIVMGDRYVAQYRVSGVFAAGDSDAFIEGVTALYPIRARREDGRIILYSDRR